MLFFPKLESRKHFHHRDHRGTQGLWGRVSACKLFEGKRTGRRTTLIPVCARVSAFSIVDLVNYRDYPALMSDLRALDLDNPVLAIRRFNRLYTRQIGVLQEHLLESQFSLTEVRVLYEIAHRENTAAKDLCSDLGLDRGYVSRMLQNFEKNGWITIAPASEDRRRQLLSLTAKGHRVFDPLERRSSDEVAAMLARLSPGQQKTMLAGIRNIESVLSPRKSSNEAFIVRQHRPGDMGWVVQRHGELYWQEYHYDERFEALVAEIVAEFIQHLDAKRERCWIAEKDSERVGVGFPSEENFVRGQASAVAGRTFRPRVGNREEIGRGVSPFRKGGRLQEDPALDPE